MKGFYCLEQFFNNGLARMLYFSAVTFWRPAFTLFFFCVITPPRYTLGVCIHKKWRRLQKNQGKIIMQIDSTSKAIRDVESLPSLLWISKIQLLLKNSLHIWHCSHPSIFSYFYSIVERQDRIKRDLDASAKAVRGEINSLWTAYAYKVAGKENFAWTTKLNLQR